MNVVEPGSRVDNIVARAKELILRPVPAWEAIDAEEATIEGLYRHWVLPLAAIPAACGALGRLTFGSFQIWGFHFRVGVLGVLTRAVAGYALTLVAVYLVALAVDELALRFGGERSRTQAFKLSAYSATAGWLGGLFLLLPEPGGLLAFLAGCYSLYLFYLGLPKLMRSDPAQTTTYFVMALLAMIGIAILMGILTSLVSGGWYAPVWID